MSRAFRFRAASRAVARTASGVPLVAAAMLQAGCAGGVPGWWSPAGRPLALPAPLERPGPAPVALPADPVEPDPSPAPSDAAGVERLQRLALLWHVVGAHHPAVAAGGIPWDSAFIRAVPRVRAADTPDAAAEAATRLLQAIGDPLTRVEPAAPGAPPPPPPPAGVEVLRTADSVLVLRLPPALAVGGDAEARVAEALRQGAARVVVDLRGARAPGAGHPVPPQWGAGPDSVVARTRLAQALAWRTAPLPVERRRVVGGARSTAGVAAPEDGWQLEPGGLLQAEGREPRRVVVVANPSTVIPRSLLALVGSRQAVLVAEEGVGDEALVSSVVVPWAPGVVVRVRTGELVHADGSVGIPVDAVVPASAPGTPADSAPALRAALALARGTGAWPPRRPAPAAPPVALPRFYEAEPYPFLGARVLAGARLWAAMRGRHAHRDLYDADLDDVFARALPALEGARNEADYVAAVRGMVAAFDDAQVRLAGGTADSAAGGATAPFRVEAVEGSALVTAVVRDAETRALGIEEGQEVTAADGFPLAAWRAEHRGDVAAPNQWAREERTVRLLPRGPSGGALFRLRDPSGRERQLNVARRAAYHALLPVVERPLQAPVRQLAPGVAYVDVERLPLDSVGALLAGLRGAGSVVLDLRGRLEEPVDGAALDRVVAPVAERDRAVVAREVVRWRRQPCLAAAWREASQQCAEAREERPLVAEASLGAPGAGAPRVVAPRVVALIDARTQGVMERLALRLEALAGATFVGTPSAGSPSEVMPVALPGGLTVTVPLAEWRRPDGGAVQRVGITPQVAAQRTVRGVRAGRDEVLERAVLWLQQAPGGRLRE